MKTTTLELVEFVAIGTSIIGTIISNVVGQAVYAATPITFTLILNLVNRDQLKKQVQENTITEINLLQKQIQQANSAVASQIGIRIQSIPETARRIEDVSNQLNQLSNSHYLLQQKFQSNLQSALNEIGTRIEKIPDMNRRIDNLNKVIDDLTNQSNYQPNIQVITQINQQIELLKSEIKILPQNQEIAKIEKTLNSLILNFNSRDEEQTILQIKERLRSLEAKSVDSTSFLSFDVIKLQEEISDLHARLMSLTNKLNNQINVDISRINSRLEHLILLMIQRIINQSSDNLSDCSDNNERRFKYELIYDHSSNRYTIDRKESREKLRKALQEAKKMIIMVCPWIANYAFDESLNLDIEQALKRDVNIYIGWGHYTDIEKLNHNIPSRFATTLQTQNPNLYSAIPKLINLQKTYSNLHLKLIGTHEKFLVCDDLWALITSHNFLTSNDHSYEREIGLWTNDQKIIHELIERYYTAPDREKAL
ncbi:hypothetical protein B9G53_10070 [Pseudanabaena sp. SR411]|uniref:phospholipase D-like domain-containing protein n=1 Tax=Pseudanabaena sp. SR411 TaxID=1980935 RepID=UPI000B98480F|nr:phospholipase D-like domain-containing protein [Pseudanabaena sp. SR411]OYQ64776.1 hypothetical protein B9G53_10070 [Pseudanabaena sp. SR411]